MPSDYITPFERGFDRALRMWRDGYTIASISHRFDGASEADRGGMAATYALDGWLDQARREARAFGLRRDEIERLIRRAEKA